MNELTDDEGLARHLADVEGEGRWLVRGIVAAVCAAALAAGGMWRSKHRPIPPSRYASYTVAAGDVTEKVQATGAVQPLLQVNVGAQVNGRVTKVLVDFNSVVKKGDVLAEIDPTIYGTQVSAQQSSVQQQRAQLAQAQAQLQASRAQLATARAAHDRTQRLFDETLASKGDLEASLGQFETASANMAGAAAAVAAARAAIGTQSAQLTQMSTNLGYTKIYSPVDGVVVSRNIDPGATVVASFQAPVLFVIAQDLKKMRVMADVDEADVGQLAEHMQADAVVDAFPGYVFHGTVQQVRYSPSTISGVVTYVAIVEVANPEEKLRPGMTATVTIKTAEAKGVLKVPNAALRFRPTPPAAPNHAPGAATQAPARLPAEPPLANGQGRVYVLTRERPGQETVEAKVVPIGVTDGVSTEVRGNALPAGTVVVTDDADDSPSGAL